VQTDMGEGSTLCRWCLETAGCEMPEWSVSIRTVVLPSQLRRSKIARRSDQQAISKLRQVQGIGTHTALVMNKR